MSLDVAEDSVEADILAESNVNANWDKDDDDDVV